MKEKKETRRYSIVEYMGPTTEILSSEEDYQKLLEFAKKNNNSITSDMFYGNISKRMVNGALTVTYHTYHELTIPRTISDIDAECSGYSDINHMLGAGYDAIVMSHNPDMYIVYFETKNKAEKSKDDFDIRIKPLPFFFADDQVFFDEEYIKKCIIGYTVIRDLNFFRDLAYNFRFNRDAYDALDRLERDINLVATGEKDIFDLSIDSMSLYKKLVYERDRDGRVIRNSEGQIAMSHRRIRDFGSFVRDRDMPAYKRLSAVKYNIPRDSRDIAAKPIEKNVPRNPGNVPNRPDKEDEIRLF